VTSDQTKEQKLRSGEIEKGRTKDLTTDGRGLRTNEVERLKS
jgi:hypothetical protein